MSDLENNIQKLQQIFEGVDQEANATFKEMEKSLQIARIKSRLRENVAAQMIINEIHSKLAVCNQILSKDRGLDRDPIMDKIYRTKLFERQDTLIWVLSLFGNDDELTEIHKTVEANMQKNKEFLPEE